MSNGAFKKAHFEMALNTLHPSVKFLSDDERSKESNRKMSPSK